MRLIISVVSGKGGTGSSLVATSLALSLAKIGPVQLLDCSVGQADDHIFLKPSFTHRETVSVPVPGVDEKRCDYCGRCAEVCAGSAIIVFAKHVLIFPELCNGCGACGYFCSAKAISEQDREIGVVEWGEAGGMSFVHGKLGIGETMAAPVISKIKEHIVNEGTVIIDVPSAKSGAVMEAIKGSHFCLVVTEPTPFGLNGLTPTLDIIRELDIPCGVVINRAGMGDGSVEDHCRKKKIPVMMKVPQDAGIARLGSRGIALVEGLPEWRQRFLGLADRVREIVSERNSRTQR